MKNNQFLGKNLVFTGASVIKRDYLFGLAEAIGANPQKGVNKQTDLLIVGEKPGNKKRGNGKQRCMLAAEKSCGGEKARQQRKGKKAQAVTKKGI